MLYRNKISQFVLGILFLVLAVSDPASADLTWAPLVFPVQVYTKLWLLPLTLLIEWPFIKTIMDYTWMSSIKPLIWLGIVGTLGGSLIAGMWGFGLEMLLVMVRVDWPGDYWPLYIMGPLVVVPTLAFLKFAVLKLLYGKAVAASVSNIVIICIPQGLIFAVYIVAYHYLPTQ